MVCVPGASNNATVSVSDAVGSPECVVSAKAGDFGCDHAEKSFSGPTTAPKTRYFAFTPAVATYTMRYTR